MIAYEVWLRHDESDCYAKEGTFFSEQDAQHYIATELAKFGESAESGLVSYEIKPVSTPPGLEVVNINES